ncbi:MAG: LEA type 2 family protein [Woeseiaceae bacterium]|nr:LEA type 2 family protein [Woeseiaceae bacterium]
MTVHNPSRNAGLLLVVLIAAGCASSTSLIRTPAIGLSGIELTSVSIRRQTFLLSFDIANPNPIPLPVKAFDYEVIFDDEKFAEGRTQGSFTVPANGTDSFAISVDLDILGSASHWKTLVSGGFREDIAYQLRGKLAVDIPLVKPLAFSSTGVVNMRQTASDQFK